MNLKMIDLNLEKRLPKPIKGFKKNMGSLFHFIFVLKYLLREIKSFLKKT